MTQLNPMKELIQIILVATITIPLIVVAVLFTDILKPNIARWWKQRRCKHIKQKMFVPQYDGTRINICDDCQKQWTVTHESRYNAKGR